MCKRNYSAIQNIILTATAVGRKNTVGDVKISLSSPSVVLKNLSRIIGSVVDICFR